MKALRRKLILVDNPVNFYGNIGVKLKQEFSTSKTEKLSPQRSTKVVKSQLSSLLKR